MELNILDTSPIKPLSRFFQSYFSWLMNKNLSLILKFVSDCQRLSTTSSTEIKNQISWLALDVNRRQLTALILNLELSIEKRLSLKKVNIFRCYDFISIGSILCFMKSNFELFFHLCNSFLELL